MSQKVQHKIAAATWLISLALIIPLCSCARQEKAANGGSAQTTFASPEDASKALLVAAKSDDQNALLGIFGQNSKDVISSGDATQDKETAAAVVSAYEVMNRWRKMDDNTKILILGADNFPFPIPLKKNDSGKWYFDTAAGRDEILARRIGRDELTAIDVCNALADAQHEYFSQRHDGVGKQYALKFISDNGKQNGLYWQSTEGQPKSPLGPLVAFATGEGYNVQPKSQQPFHGYYFRMLDKQGTHAQGGAEDYLVDGKMVNGFAFVAYPAQYGNSGIMTFIINQNGVLYQKDLGKNTAEVATAMDTFDPEDTWTQVE